MEILIASLVLGLSVGGGLAVQGYFIYRMVNTIAVLKAAPDVKSATTLLRTTIMEPKEKEKEKEPLEVNPGSWDKDAISAIRKVQ